MLFNSYFFILVFLPICIAGFYTVSRLEGPFSKWFLIGMSLWFYCSYDLRFPLVLTISIILNYVTSRTFMTVQLHKKAILAVALAANILLLVYYKYMNFFIMNINELFGTQLSSLKLLFPVGISYFTLQQIAYLVDAYKGECTDIRFDEYILYVIYFPHIVSGPILLQEEMIPQMRSRDWGCWNSDTFARGINQFVFGLAKKVLIADMLGPVVDYAYANHAALTSAEVFLAIFTSSFQLYFDFSGYCDMATGISHMLGISLPVNFDSPYKALSFGEFWRRWHATLGRFFRKYLYIPLGGNRKGTAVLIANTLIVFILSGIWHGANFTFALWGLLHGLFVVLMRVFKQQYEKIPRVVRLVLTFLLVSLLWGLFRANSVGQYAEMLRRAFSFEELTVSSDMANLFHIPGSETAMVFIFGQITRYQTNLSLLLTVLVFSYIFCVSTNNTYRRQFRLNVVTAMLLPFLFILSLLSFSNVESFIYINF